MIRPIQKTKCDWSEVSNNKLRKLCCLLFLILVFRYKAFKARKKLCAIDHNYHLYRQPQTDESGEKMFHRRYNQRTKHWGVALEKSKKDYSYIPMLMAKIFKLRKNDSGSMQDFMDMSLNDPRRIAPTIAISNPPITSELVATQRSRFDNVSNNNCWEPFK